jgi:hypothetical protein
MLGAIAIGITMAHLLELPLLRYRDRKFPSRTRASRSGAGQRYQERHPVPYLITFQKTN